MEGERVPPVDTRDLEITRRAVLRVAGTVAASLGMAGLLLSALVGPAASQPPMKIGVIGAGRIGGTLGEHWVKAGHDVLLSSRHPENLRELADRLGPRAGFEPVVVGPLARAKDFDAGTRVFGRGLTARELRQRLGIGP